MRLSEKKTTNYKVWGRAYSSNSSLNVGLSPSQKKKKNHFICFNKSPLKMMKNAFYFIFKALFVLKIFKFLSWFFDDVEKTALLER